MHLTCKTCGASLSLPEGERTTTCLFCASPHVIHLEETQASPNPDFGIGFSIQRDTATALAMDRTRRAWLAPEAFRRAKASDIRGVYLPVYLYSASAKVGYRANIGENYTDTETYTVRDSQGRSQTRTRSVIRTEWRSLEGRYQTRVLNHLVTASLGLSNELLEVAEPFDLSELRRYEPALVAGWATEAASISAEESGGLARREAQAQLSGDIASFLPGDSQQDLRLETQYFDEDLSLVLIPMWILPIKYRADKDAIKILINGQLGEVVCPSPRSWFKVGLLILLAIAIVVGLLMRGRIL